MQKTCLENRDGFLVWVSQDFDACYLVINGTGNYGVLVTRTDFVHTGTL